MIYLTASDIVKQAKWFSNTTNSPLTDFYINTNILSSIYKDLYLDIIGNSNQFITTVETSANEFELSDVYKIAWVGDKNGNEILRSTLRTRQTGGYYIENNILHLPAGNKVIKYSTLPQTITCPDIPEVVELESYPALMSNAGIEEDYTITTESKFFHGETIDFSNLPDWLDKPNTTIKNVNVSDPYIFVSYTDGSVRLYDDSYSFTDWNPNIAKGKRFDGYVLAFTSDDSTGKGVLYYDNLKKQYFYGSFVPDTVLAYPNNTLYQLMIYKLAAILASMVGLDNPYLVNNLLPEAERKFYQSISKGSASRVANIYGGRAYV